MAVRCARTRAAAPSGLQGRRHAALLAVCGASALLVPLPYAARAEPVPIGRYAELRVGVSHGHLYATSGADARRTARSRAHAPAREPKRVWRVLLPHPQLVPPAVLDDGTLIVGSAGGVHALDPGSGEQRWFVPTGPVRFTPSVTPEGELIALGGGKLWRVTRGGEAHELALSMRPTGAPLVLASGTVIVTGDGGVVQALTSSGAVVATFTTFAQQPRLPFTAHVSGDSFVVAGERPEVSLLSLRGAPERTLHLGQGLLTSPLVSDDLSIWLVGDAGTVFVSGPDGALRASIALAQGGASEDPALGWDGALRLGLRYGEVVCVAPDGRVLFRHGIDGPPGPMLIDADDTLLFLGQHGALYAIARDGELRYRASTGLRGAGRPVLGADGTIYIVARGGEIEAWR